MILLRALSLLLAGVLPAAAAGALPLLSEVVYDAPGSDDGSVFVEIQGAPGSSVDGLVLEGRNGSGGSVTVRVALRGYIDASGLFVVADGDVSGTTQVAKADQIADFDLQNGPDSLVLLSGGQVLDALGYGRFASGDVFAGEGHPAPDVAPGQSLARRLADVDTDDNAADWIVLSSPTPGAAPFSVPEPGSLGLLGVAAWTLGRRFRARV